MAKAKKLPSGSWRVQVFSHKDAKGKPHYESFTAPTKAEAEMLAAEFKADKSRRSKHDLTVEEAVNGYISAKEGVLSPSTIREYKKMLKRFDAIKGIRIRKLSSESIQLWVSDLSQQVSPKTVRNTYALLTASLALYNPDMVYRVTLPAKEVKRPVSPSSEAVRGLYQAASEHLKPCIGLAICGVRRGEIAALKYEDIKDGIAHIHADMVQNSDKEWVYKPIPKTSGGDRYLKIPKAVLDLIGTGTGFIITWYNPNSITKEFERLANKQGVSIRLHDLRHYYASIGAILGVPDIYMAEMGGWRHDSNVMKEVYQNKITSMADYYSDKLNEHLDENIFS
ncbi:MAG: tyrosine-type recombinase/integrase [Lachnospiraceae bacterium]|nr:tyrosine-type recombinase/integrase [Lachnospiraceae bacterium]